MNCASEKYRQKASVGILMLDSQFPRIEGDVGNEQTWPFPVQYKVVSGASPHKVVREKRAELLESFVDAAIELAADGVDGITTTCGFLSVFQRELAEAVKIPVATSSLMQVAMVNQLLPPGKVTGILTISGSSLTKEHLVSANVPLQTPIGSTENGCEFTRAILENDESMDIVCARKDNVEAARALIAENPQVGAVVLECTNMCPYADDIARAIRMPVFSMVTFVNWFQCGLRPPQYPSV